MLFPWTVAFGFAMGAAAGSFTNVLIWRLPRGQSIREPQWSYCPSCNSRLTFLDLVPLLSFLLLGARCRHCRKPVPWRYFWVELVCASLWGLLWWQNMVVAWAPAPFLAYALFGTALVAIVWIDFEHYIIPDQLNAWLLLVGVALGVYRLATHDPAAWVLIGSLRVPAFLVGAWTGTLILWGIGAFGRILFRKDAMGHGDVKMMRGAGALLPMDMLLASIGIAVALGAVIGAAMLVYLRAHRMTEEEPEPEGKQAPVPPEPIALLPIWLFYYLLWLDLLSLLAPKAGAVVDGFVLRLAKKVAPEAKLEEEEAEETFQPSPTTIAFGPFLAMGVAATLLLAPQIRAAIRAYLSWITGGN